jgi:hypothetical protein
MELWIPIISGAITIMVNLISLIWFFAGMKSDINYMKVSITELKNEIDDIRHLRERVAVLESKTGNDHRTVQ